MSRATALEYEMQSTSSIKTDLDESQSDSNFSHL